MAESHTNSPLPVGFKKDGTPQKRNNQWTRAKELGRDLGDKDKDRHRAECVAAMLEQHTYGKRKMSQSQVQAAKVLISVGKPSLQAVESTTVEPAMTMSEEGMLASLVQAMQSYPHLVQLALARIAQSSPTPVSDTQQPKTDAA